MSNATDTVAFYDGKKLVALIPSAMVPPVGCFVTINKVTWLVKDVTYAVGGGDRNPATGPRTMHAFVDVVTTMCNQEGVS